MKKIKAWLIYYKPFAVEGILALLLLVVFLLIHLDRYLGEKELLRAVITGKLHKQTYVGNSPYFQVNLVDSDSANSIAIKAFADLPVGSCISVMKTRALSGRVIYELVDKEHVRHCER